MLNFRQISLIGLRGCFPVAHCDIILKTVMKMSVHKLFKKCLVCTYCSNCDRLCNMLLSIVSHKSKGTGYQICFILMYICKFICI